MKVKFELVNTEKGIEVKLFSLKQTTLKNLKNRFLNAGVEVKKLKVLLLQC